MTFPLIISADDHIVAPADLWTSRLPAALAERGPRVVRERGLMATGSGPDPVYRQDNDGEATDVWHFGDVRVPMSMVASAVGYPREDIENRLVTFDDVRPGCYDPAARLSDMDEAGIEAQLCFPNMFVRFCGQRFLHEPDKQLALACVRAYNDFVLDEWCAGSGGRLIPSGIVPLWDPDLAAAEVRRCAAFGMRAISFTELAPALGLPSIYTDHWDPFFTACEETQTVVMEHVGSSSQVPRTADEAPPATYHCLVSNNSAAALVDWLCAAMPVRFPGLNMCLTESQIGWIPYYLGRLDRLWDYQPYTYTGRSEMLTELPSTYFRSNIYATFFEDRPGIKFIDEIGVDNVLFETDYPHGDSTWPNCREVAIRETEGLSEEYVEKVIRGNAKRLFRLD